MVQLLDRYRRISDGKEFAVLATGGLTPALRDRVALEAEDGERLESTGSALREEGRYEFIED